MKAALIIIAFLFCGKLSAQDTTYQRHFYFNDLDLAGEKCEVVLIVKNPQTKIASEIKGRIFSNSVDAE